jgi:pyruvate/2-oxoglutarate dehydrogenase complex dihydrolipoamide dehydrogenase (E3) component
MESQALEHDFDVAIIGCGAYGFPLASRLKKQGRKAIHLGGPTQLLFGIKGNRWDSMPDHRTLYNEHWVRPKESEKPLARRTVGQDSYW